MVEQDYYSVLGLVPDAEMAVIKAAYRALVTIYHPDKNGESRSEEKLKIINVAYSVLSDPNKRKQYDESRESQSRNAFGTDFEKKSPFLESPIEKQWSVAVSFYSDIENIASRLERLSWKLAFAFKLDLLESQDFKNASKKASRMRVDYLSRYFGKNKEIQDYAEKIIISGFTEVVLNLNQIICVMGGSVSIYQIKERFKDKYPELIKTLSIRDAFQEIKYSNGLYDYYSVVSFIGLLGGRIKKELFGRNVSLVLPEEEYNFSSLSDLYRFIEERFSSYG